MSRTWVKLYVSFLDHPAIGRLDDRTRLIFIECFTLAARVDDDGRLGSMEDVAWALRRPVSHINAAIGKLDGRVFLLDGQLFVRDWSDHQPARDATNAERQARHRARNAVTEPVTSGGVTALDKNREEETSPPAQARARKTAPSSDGRGRDEFFDVYCELWGFDPGRPTDGIRGLAGDFSARCKRLEPPPAVDDIRRWAEHERARRVNGQAAWGSVTRKHSGADSFVGWWQSHANDAPAATGQGVWV